MRAMDRVANWFGRLVAKKAAEPDMLCNDCPRGENCGDAPSKECLTKLEMRASGQADFSAYNAVRSKTTQV